MRACTTVLLSVLLAGCAHAWGGRTWAAWNETVNLTEWQFQQENAPECVVDDTSLAAYFGARGVLAQVSDAAGKRNAYVGKHLDAGPDENHTAIWFSPGTLNSPAGSPVWRAVVKLWKRGAPVSPSQPRLQIAIEDKGTTFQLSARTQDDDFLGGVTNFGSVIAQSSWNHLYLYQKKGAEGSGVIRVYLNGIQRFSADTLETDDSMWDSIQVGISIPTGVATTGSVWFDNAEHDTTGGFRYWYAPAATPPAAFAYDPASAFSVLTQEAPAVTYRKVQDGAFLVDDFDDGVLDTVHGNYPAYPTDDSTKWHWLGGGGAAIDERITLTEESGYFRLSADTITATSPNQHNGIESRYYAANLNHGWPVTVLDTIDVVAICELLNVDYAMVPTPNTVECRLEYHLCSNCPGAAVDHNATVTIGFLAGGGGTPVHDEWYSPGRPGWGGRYVWNNWATRALYMLRQPEAGPDSLFGDEATTYHPAMIVTRNSGTQPTDSTDIETYVFGDGAWEHIATQSAPQMYMGSRCKVELKTMLQSVASGVRVEYRFDNFRLFLPGDRYPVLFDLKQRDGAVLAEAGWSLEMRCARTSELLDADTSGVSDSQLAVYMDHTKVIVPEDVECTVRFLGSLVGSFTIAGSGVNGCYPDDVYEIRVRDR